MHVKRRGSSCIPNMNMNEHIKNYSSETEPNRGYKKVQQREKRGQDKEFAAAVTHDVFNMKIAQFFNMNGDWKGNNLKCVCNFCFFCRSVVLFALVIVGI